LIQLNQQDLSEFIKVRVALSRRSFWQFCVTSDPEFYKPDRKHLKLLCTVLQGLHDGTIVRREGEDWRFIENDEDLAGLEVCRKLIINMPPRFGKTRTVVLFESWCLGKNPKVKFVTGSYNDDAAADISRYVRDTISQEAQTKFQVIYGDIFPNTKLKGNDKSVARWAVEGSYFTYIGTGPGGTATGKGADYLIVDDPVKNAETAFNSPAMQKLNSWVMNTLLSRTEAGAKTLIVHTRWPNGDLTDAFEHNKTDIDQKEYKKFFHLVLAANDDGLLLCEDILNEEDYTTKKTLMDPTIFEANYNQKIIRPEGALYKNFKAYDSLPKDEDGQVKCERKLCFIDTADKGEDFLCAVMGIQEGSFAYMTDVVYTQVSVEYSLPMVVEAIMVNDIKEIRVEANSGGSAYARELDKMLVEKHYMVYIEEYSQQSNKETRIISNSAAVQERILVPSDWEQRFPQFSWDLMQHLRVGKNRHDDAPDATTGFYEFAFDGGVILA